MRAATTRSRRGLVGPAVPLGGRHVPTRVGGGGLAGRRSRTDCVALSALQVRLLSHSIAIVPSGPSGYAPYDQRVPADAPTILATSGGAVPADRIRWSVGPLTDYAVELSGVSGRAPRVCFLGTACGDNPQLIKDFYDMSQAAGFHGTHLQLFTMPNVDDMRDLLLGQDVIWVWGGSVAGLLAMWRLHGVDALMREAWQAGGVLAGGSARA